MKIGVVTVTVGYWAGLEKLVKSFYENSPYEQEFYIIPNLLKEYSLAEAWNKGIRRAIWDRCDYIVVANDDTYLGDKDALPKIIHHMESNNLWICRTQPNEENVRRELRGFHFFVITQDLISEVGYFDENFYPAYLEDDDLHYRTLIVNPLKTDMIVVNVPHEEGRSISDMSKEERRELGKMVEELRAYYANKWGGDPNHERWTKPFEGYSLKENTRIRGMSFDGLIDVAAPTFVGRAYKPNRGPE